jgi:hypothetical protein
MEKKTTSGQQFMKLDFFFVCPSFFNTTLVSDEKEQEQDDSMQIPQIELISNLFKSCFMYTLFHSIVHLHIGSTSEVQRFLTADNCTTGSIHVDLTPLIHILPVLSEEERQTIDSEVMNGLDYLNCTIFNEYMVVNCPTFPCIIRFDLLHPKRRSIRNNNVFLIYFREL